MNHTEVTNLVLDILARREGTVRAELSPQTHLVDDLGFDSLDTVELLSSLHKATGREVAIDGLSNLGTVNDLVAAVLSNETPTGASCAR